MKSDKGINPDGSQRLGLLGGTFDPVHNGHLALAGFVRDSLALDGIVFIPSHIPPHKISGKLSSFADRLAMLELALEEEPTFSISTMESERKGPSYSVDTLRELRHSGVSGRSYYFIIGMDAFMEINTWKEYGKIPDLADLVVIDRPEFPMELFSQAVRQLGDYSMNEDGVFWTSREHPGRIYTLSMPPMAISSTDLRSSVASGSSIFGQVPDEVAKYIMANKMYV